MLPASTSSTETRKFASSSNTNQNRTPSGVRFFVFWHAWAGGERTLRIRLQRDYGIGVMLYAELWRADERDALDELYPPVQRAQCRGAILDCVSFPEQPRRVELRASLSPIELSRQGGKEKHLLLGGRSIFTLIPPEITFEKE